MVHNTYCGSRCFGHVLSWCDLPKLLKWCLYSMMLALSVACHNDITKYWKFVQNLRITIHPAVDTKKCIFWSSHIYDLCGLRIQWNLFYIAARGRIVTMAPSCAIRKEVAVTKIHNNDITEYSIKEASLWLSDIAFSRLALKNGVNKKMTLISHSESHYSVVHSVG